MIAQNGPTKKYKEMCQDGFYVQKEKGKNVQKYTPGG